MTAPQFIIYSFSKYQRAPAVPQALKRQPRTQQSPPDRAVGEPGWEPAPQPPFPAVLLPARTTRYLKPHRGHFGLHRAPYPACWGNRPSSVPLPRAAHAAGPNPSGLPAARKPGPGGGGAGGSGGTRGPGGPGWAGGRGGAGGARGGPGGRASLPPCPTAPRHRRPAREREQLGPGSAIQRCSPGAPAFRSTSPKALSTQKGEVGSLAPQVRAEASTACKSGGERLPKEPSRRSPRTAARSQVRWRRAPPCGETGRSPQYLILFLPPAEATGAQGASSLSGQRMGQTPVKQTILGLETIAGNAKCYYYKLRAPTTVPCLTNIQGLSDGLILSQRGYSMPVLQRRLKGSQQTPEEPQSPLEPRCTSSATSRLKPPRPFFSARSSP